MGIHCEVESVTCPCRMSDGTLLIEFAQALNQGRAALEMLREKGGYPTWSHEWHQIVDSVLNHKNAQQQETCASAKLAASTLDCMSICQIQSVRRL